MTFAVKIGGMSCAHCKKSVTEALGSLQGAKNVAVEIGSAFLVADCTANEIKETIEELGFDVLGVEEE